MQRPDKRNMLKSDVLSFRISTEDKEKLVSEVERIRQSKNDSLPDEFKRYKMNDVLLEALRLGLRSLRSLRSKKD